MTTMRIFSTLLAAIFIASPLQNLLANGDLLSEVTPPLNPQALLEDYIEMNGGVGGALCLIDQGDVQFYTYGNLSLQSNDNITKDTIFELGSLTKVFTTLALVDMVSKGLVGLDDPIDLYLPEVNVPQYQGKKITFRNLATHSSGLPRMPDNFHPQNAANPYADYTEEDLYDFLNRYTLKAAPGQTFEYSNVGMGLLGNILCKIANKPYEKLIQDLVEDSLQMHSTGINITQDMLPCVATGSGWHQEVGHWDFPTLPGMAALHSTLSDMANFLSAAMGITPSPTSDLIRYCEQKQFGLSDTMGIGLGWIVSNTSHANIIWHNGSVGGFKSFLGYNTDTMRGVVVLSNSAENWPDDLALHLLDPHFNPVAIDRDLANCPEYLHRFVGPYVSIPAKDQAPQEFQVFVYQKQLVLVLSGNDIALLYPESFGIFSVKGFPDGKIQFTFNTDRKIAKVEMVGQNDTVIWEAIPKPS